MSHGINDSLLKWLEDWISERKQRVVINGKFSSCHNVLSGVPQGAVLGPILFLVYLDNIDEGLTCKILKFADDTKISSKVTIASKKKVTTRSRYCKRLGKKGENEIKFIKI